MTNEPYTLLEAIRDERDTLLELKKTYEELDKRLLAASVRDSARMLDRILNRYEKGYEYYMGIDEGQPRLKHRQTTRHLEREYPAVAKAKRNLDIVTDLVKGKDDV